MGADVCVVGVNQMVVGEGVLGRDGGVPTGGGGTTGGGVTRGDPAGGDVTGGGVIPVVVGDGA